MSEVREGRPSLAPFSAAYATTTRSSPEGTTATTRRRGKMEKTNAVPKGRLPIARRFSAGFMHKRIKSRRDDRIPTTADWICGHAETWEEFCRNRQRLAAHQDVRVSRNLRTEQQQTDDQNGEFHPNPPKPSQHTAPTRAEKVTAVLHRYPFRVLRCKRDTKGYGVPRPCRALFARQGGVFDLSS